MTNNQNKSEELQSIWLAKNETLFFRILYSEVRNGNQSLLKILYYIIENEKENGIIIRETAKAIFRLKRKSIADCETLLEFADKNIYIINEALLDVLGYDKMKPELDVQRKIIDLFFNFGDKIDRKYLTDPRYGLAAACAGWDQSICESFLKYCLSINDAPLNYVAKNSLKQKYVKLR